MELKKQDKNFGLDDLLGFVVGSAVMMGGCKTAIDIANKSQPFYEDIPSYLILTGLIITTPIFAELSHKFTKSLSNYLGDKLRDNKL